MWRDLAAKHQLPQEHRYLQAYEDGLSSRQDALKNSVKYDKDCQHLCRAIWRRKRARRRHVDGTKKLECCEEERAPPGKSKYKHVNWERVCGSSDVPKALSYFNCTIFEFPLRPRTKIENASQKHRRSSATRSYSHNESTSLRNTTTLQTVSPQRHSNSAHFRSHNSHRWISRQSQRV